jgi:hypothetical protein
MNEEQENGVTVKGRNVNTATPKSANCAHTEFFHLFENCMGTVTAQRHVLLLNLGIISALSREAACPRGYPFCEISIFSSATTLNITLMQAPEML